MGPTHVPDVSIGPEMPASNDELGGWGIVLLNPVASVPLGVGSRGNQETEKG